MELMKRNKNIVWGPSKIFVIRHIYTQRKIIQIILYCCVVINEKKNNAKRENLKIFPQKAEISFFFLFIILLISFILWKIQPQNLCTYVKVNVLRESSLSDRKRILSDPLFGSFLPQPCLSCSQWFSLPHTISYLSCLSSAWAFPIGTLNVLYLLHDGCLSEHHWSKNLLFDQPYTSVYRSLCCQSFTAPSFLNIRPQHNFSPYITMIVHSESERGIFPSAAVTFQYSWCLVIACLHPALFFFFFFYRIHKASIQRDSLRGNF